jgi:preprotein translocase subunit SecG
MENVLLVVHMILALLLIGVVLLQRNEGGGLGIGGGGNVLAGRSAGNALTRLTWIIATAFVLTSILLTVIASRKAAQDSVLDRLGGAIPAETAPAESAGAGLTGDLTPDLTPGPTAPPAVEVEPAS